MREMRAWGSAAGREMCRMGMTCVVPARATVDCVPSSPRVLCSSRLGCQIKATKDLDGITVRIPSATRNFAVDGFVPKPH